MAASTSFSASSFYSKKSKRTNAVPVQIPEDEESDDGLVAEDSDDENYIPDDNETSDDEILSHSESEEEHSGDDPPLARLVNKQNPSRSNSEITWSANSWNIPEQSKFEEKKLKLKPEFEGKITVHSSPYDFFQLIFHPELVENILFQTRNFNTWRSLQDGGRKKLPQFSKSELLKAFGIILYMGVVKLPNRRMYWSNAAGIQAIYDTLSRNRFDEILSTLHFNDNEKMKKPGEVGFSRCYKLLPLIESLRQRFSYVVEEETNLAVDEMMIPFKGRHGLKKYMPKKPVKWGYKMWCRAGISGYVYDFELCDESKGLPEGVTFDKPLGEYSAVVVRMTHELEPNKHKVFFDNLFSCPELLMYMRTKGIYAVSTIQENRTRNSKIASEKILKSQGRGAIDEKTYDDKVVICAWLDSKRVLTASNYIGKEPVGQCKRYDRKEKKEIIVPRPASVEHYNKFMGGVDKADMLLSLYRSKCRSRKWYIRIFTHLLSLCVVNAWCIYRQMGGASPIIDFLIDIARTLMAGVEHASDQEDAPKAKKPRVSYKATDVPANIRYDGRDHWPFQMDKQNRCKGENCSRRSRFMCTKCKVVLCVVGSECFLKYHNVL